MALNLLKHISTLVSGVNLNKYEGGFAKKSRLLWLITFSSAQLVGTDVAEGGLEPLINDLHVTHPALFVGETHQALLHNGIVHALSLHNG